MNFVETSLTVEFMWLAESEGLRFDSSFFILLVTKRKNIFLKKPFVIRMIMLIIHRKDLFVRDCIQWIMGLGMPSSKVEKVY